MPKLSEIVQEKLAKAGIKPASCRGCNEAIIFLRTADGKLMPLGLDLSPHWKTCTNPQQFRKKDNQKKPAPVDQEPELDDEMPV